jgi:preprotein translocase subunit SecE
MSNIQVETVTSIADKAKIVMALLIIVGGIVSFSVFETTYSGPIRFGIFVLSLLIAAGIVAISEPGRRFIGFTQASYHEVRKVIWPTRKETINMTGIVFAFVAVMGVFLWVLDKLIEWVLYVIVLGWK